jgi:hypothetical protein
MAANDKCLSESNKSHTGSKVTNASRKMILEPKMRKIAILALTAVVLGACAGRSPQPVAVVQPQDQFTDCAAIRAEVEANNRRVQELASEEGLKTTQNVAAGVAGLFIPVLWFGMDFQGAASKEVAALQSRQQYLATLAGQRCRRPGGN